MGNTIVFSFKERTGEYERDSAYLSALIDYHILFLYRLKPTFFDWFHINDTKLADIVICIN